MQIFKIETTAGPRYVRAYTLAQARVRAYKVWQALGATLAIGQSMPAHVGAFGYDQAVNSIEHKASPVAQDRLVGFYNPDAAQQTRVSNKALAIMARLGLS